MQITTTKLLEELKATEGGYIGRSGLDGKLYLKEDGGRDKLGPIPHQMMDDLERQGLVKRDGLRYQAAG